MIMTPHLATRYSPARNPIFGGEIHKRGQSFEGGLISEENDDDLELFKEVQSRERENFLLQPAYDIDHALSTKFRYSSDLGLGFSFAVREEHFDLLKSEGEKNDYDWLLTPPETPLFPSLDDETPPVNLMQHGRSQTRPRSISRSSTMEKRCRNNRSQSPHPGRPSSAPSSTPVFKRKEEAPTCTLSSRNKSASTIRRSSTPSSRRISTGSSSSIGSSGVREASPVRETRGNSSSPKFRAWQSNIPGFSMDAPPNLRTSLADRPAYYVRGSSPASRCSMDSTSRSSNISRRSISPSASRSIASSCSHRPDQFSPCSKGSVTSSAADDLDSLQSIHARSSQGIYAKNSSAFSNNKSITPKRQSRSAVSCSAPKGSFGSTFRQMGQKSHQKMFRPLISSVPNTSFYAGGPSSSHRSTMSRNSSITTSSYTSSDLGTVAALDIEGGDLNHEDIKLSSHEIQEEIFCFEDNTKPEARGSSFNAHPSCRDKSDVPEGSGSFHRECTEVESSTSELCSNCGKKFHLVGSAEESDDNLCPDCRSNKHVPSGSDLVHSSSVTDVDSLHLHNADEELSGRNTSSRQSEKDIDVNHLPPWEEQSQTFCAHPNNGDILPRSAEATDVNSIEYCTQNQSQAYFVDVIVELGERNTGGNVSPRSMEFMDRQSHTHTIDLGDGNDGRKFSQPLSAEGMDVNSLPEHWSKKQSHTYPVDHCVGNIEDCILVEDLLQNTSVESTKIVDAPKGDTMLHEFTEPPALNNAACESSGNDKRSLTLEEATEVVLYCSSIVHELAYEAADIALDKERPKLPENSHMVLSVEEKPSSDKYVRGRTSKRRSLMPSRTRQKAVETEARAPLTDANGSRTEVLTQNDNGERPSTDCMRHPPKPESKCNCIVM